MDVTFWLEKVSDSGYKLIRHDVGWELTSPDGEIVKSRAWLDDALFAWKKHANLIQWSDAHNTWVWIG